MTGNVSQQETPRSTFCPLCPSTAGPSTFTGQISLQSDCSSAVCRSNLRAGLAGPGDPGSAWLLGSGPRLELELELENLPGGEAAYQPSLVLSFPAILQLGQQLATCTEERRETEAEELATLVCSLPGPLLPGATRKSVMHTINAKFLYPLVSQSVVLHYPVPYLQAESAV